MTQAQATHPNRTLTRWDVIRAMVVIAAVLIAVVTLLTAFGMPGFAPSYDIVPDPAAPLGF